MKFGGNVQVMCLIPSSTRRGGCAEGADGVVAHKLRSSKATAPLKDASRHLLDVASTPPHEEGSCRSTHIKCVISDLSCDELDPRSPPDGRLAERYAVSAGAGQPL